MLTIRTWACHHACNLIFKLAQVLCCNCKNHWLFVERRNSKLFLAFEKIGFYFFCVSKEIFVKQKNWVHGLRKTTFSYCHIIQLNTKKTKKNMKSLFVHLLIGITKNSNVMAQWRWCQMMMTMMWKRCVLWWAQQLGMKFISCWIWVWKWVLSLIVTICTFLLLCFQFHSMYGANTRLEPCVWILYY